MNKKTLNSLSFVPKTDMYCAKNMQVITRCGTRTKFDRNKPDPIKHIERNDYPNCQKQKYLFKDAEKVFEDLSTNEEKEKTKSHTIKEILHLLSNEKVAQRMVDVLSILKEESNSPKIAKNIAYMISNIQNDLNPKLTYK